MEEYTELEKKILFTINEIGPTFISKLANRILGNQIIVGETVKKLVKDRLLERVENIMVQYKTRDNNIVTKHRNHTYYQLTKSGIKAAESISDTTLEVREAFKTYNKSLQNILDNSTILEEQKIQCFISFPYNLEQEVKRILADDFNSMETLYENMIEMRGEITLAQKSELEKLFNLIII